MIMLGLIGEYIGRMYISMNHSPQFYAEVEKVFPEYKKWHKWLNDNGGVYMGRLSKQLSNE